MRHREKSTLVTATATNTQLKVGGGNTTSQYNGCVSGTFSAIDDVITPRYAFRRDRGDIIMNPMTRYTRVFTVNPKSTSWVWSPPGAPGSVYGFDASDAIALRFPAHTGWVTNSYSGDLDNGWSEYAKGLALTEALSHANEPSMLALVSLTEWRQTAQLVGEMLRLLKVRSESFRKLKQLKASGKLKSSDYADEVSNLWLKSRYGVQPLISDIIGILKAFDRGTGQNVRETQRANSSSGSTQSDSEVFTATSSMVANISLTKTYTKHPSSYRAGVINSYTTSFRNSFGLGLADIPGFLWEATRLSFVADWFVNTGDYLSALTASSRADILGCYVTGTGTFEQVFTYSESGPCKLGNQVSSALSNGSGASIRILATRVTRWPMSAGDIVWGPNLNLSTKRLVDGCALLSKTFR